jgi:hypothetical protein
MDEEMACCCQISTGHWKGENMRLTVKSVICLVVTLVLVAGVAQLGQARLKYSDQSDNSRSQRQPLAKTTDIPYTTLAVHNVGNFYLSVTNWGFFGSQNGGFIDPKTGLQAPGAEFPAGSKIDYLFQGALWITAIVGIDTITSTGHDGWLSVSEMFPETLENGGDIIELSNRPGSEFYSEDAVSEQDFIAAYTDKSPNSASRGRPGRGTIRSYLIITILPIWVPSFDSMA